MTSRSVWHIPRRYMMKQYRIRYTDRLGWLEYSKIFLDERAAIDRAEKCLDDAQGMSIEVEQLVGGKWVVVW